MAEVCWVVTFRLRVLRINSTRSFIDFWGWAASAAGVVEFESSSAVANTGTRAKRLAEARSFFNIAALFVDDVRIP